MEDNQKILDEAAVVETSKAVKKTGLLRSLVDFQTLLLFAGGLLIFSFITLYFSNSGVKELYKNQENLAKKDSLQDDLINVIQNDIVALKNSFRTHVEQDSINFIGIGNDLTRHDNEIKSLQRSGRNSNYSNLVRENKEIKSRLSVLESSFSNSSTSNVNNVTNVNNSVLEKNTKPVKNKNLCVGLSEEECEELMAELEETAEAAASQKENNAEENAASAEENAGSN